MAKPNSRETFRNYCMRKLGWPVIEINIDDDQVEDRIDEALEFYQQFHHDAIQKQYLEHQISQDDLDHQYFVIDDSVIGITRIIPMSTGINTNSIFDFKYQFALNDFTGVFRGGPGSLIPYYLTQQHLRLIEIMFHGTEDIRFNRREGKLYVDVDWTYDMQLGKYIIMEAYVILNPETYTRIWSDFMLQNLCAEMLRAQWGANMAKYSLMKLPGGTTMNGLEIMEKADAKIELIKQQIRDEFEAPPAFFMA